MWVFEWLFMWVFKEGYEGIASNKRKDLRGSFSHTRRSSGLLARTQGVQVGCLRARWWV